MARLSSLAKKLTEQNGTEVETAVCEIFRNLGKERESVGQGCLVRTKQSNECCVVTADEVIPNGQLDTFEVEFTRGDSKLKRFFLKDIKKNVYYNSGLVIIVIDLESVKKQHKKNTWSMFTKSSLTVAALEESKKQISYFGKKRFNVIVSRNSTIKFPDHTPPTIPNGLVILQTASNSTDDDVFVIGIQSQVDGSQKITWMNKILDSLFAPITAPDPSSMETPNPHTASTRTPANGDGQQSLVGAAADQPDNEPQNPVLNGGTAAGDVTDVSHTSSIDNEDRADYTTPATGDADHNSQRIEGASWLGRINGGFPEQENSPTNRSMKEESEHGATGGASDQQDVTVAENFEHYPGFKSCRRPSPSEDSYQSFQKPASTIPLREIDNSVSQLVVTDGRGYRGSTVDNVTPLGKQHRHSYPYHAPKKEEQGNMKRSFSEATMKKRKIKPDDPLAKTILDRLDLLEGLSRCLDKEYMYGSSQCWKHLAERFGIAEKTYQSFKCSMSHSPTEVMFEYLQTTDTEITIGKLKEKLRSIERQDVIDILVECEKTDCPVNDGTLVCSLFDSNPDIIGRIAFLLDRQKVGLKDWVQLAVKLGIPRNVYKSFETCYTNNPTEGLFNYLKIHFPKMRVGELITHLEAMKRPDVVKAIEKSTEVKSGSLIEDLVGDLHVMDDVSELLNQKLRTNKVQGWRHLGVRLKIKTVILDDLSPPQEDLECPTVALIRHLGSWKPYLKIADFIRELHKIERPDAIAILEGYLPDVSEQL